MHRVASFDHFFEDVVRDARRREWWIPTRANECVNELSEDDVVLRLVGHRPSASPLAWAASAELPQRRSGAEARLLEVGPLEERPVLAVSGCAVRTDASAVAHREQGERCFARARRRASVEACRAKTTQLPSGRQGD